MTGTTATKPYESLPQPNEAKPITADTFSWWSIQVARIKRFNGVKNDIQIMAVYSHLLGWRKTTGDVRPSQQYIADCCCMGLSTVQKTVKKLVAMGWITATTIRKPGSKEISHTVYTVKDPEKIMMELNTALVTQGDEAVKVVKNQKQKIEGSKNDGKSESKEQQPAPVVESVTADTRESASIQQPVDHRVDAVSANDAVRVEEAPPFLEQAQDQRKLPQGTKRGLPKSFSQTKGEGEDDDWSYEEAAAKEWRRQNQQRENYH